MKRMIDITGRQYGRLTVTGFVRRDKRLKSLWQCQCACGNVIIVRACDIQNGHTTSCGCRRKEKQRASVTIHGAAETRLYHIWEKMKGRCLNASNRDYKHYGGRGITVYKEWADSFEAFCDWALTNGYRDDLTIDRIDNDGPYCPENCRWQTAKQQANNRRSNRMITYNSETRTLTQWAELTGIKRETLCHRLRNGWSVERALSEEVRACRSVHT